MKMLSLKVPKIKFPVSVEPGRHRHPSATLVLQARLTRGRRHAAYTFCFKPPNNLQGTLYNTQR